MKKDNYKVFVNKSKYKKAFRETTGEDFLIDFFSLQLGKVVLSTVGAGVAQSIFLMKNIEIINWNNQFNKFVFIRLVSLLLIFLKSLKKHIKIN